MWEASSPDARPPKTISRLRVVLDDVRHRLGLFDRAQESSPSLDSFAFFAA